MADTKKKAIEKTTAAQKEPATKAASTKKLLIVVLVIVVVAIVAIVVDNATRSPAVNSDLDATNRLFEMNVLYDNPEIGYETPVEITESVEEEIGGAKYFKLSVIANYDTDPKEFGPYYVAAKDGKIYTKDAVSGQLIPYGV